MKKIHPVYGVMRKGCWSFGIDYAGKRLDVTFFRLYFGIDWIESNV